MSPGIACSDVEFLSAGEVVCTLPVLASDTSYEVTVRNDGWDAWSEANLYRLSHAVLPEGSPAATAPDYDSTLPNRILLPGGTTVNPGESITFSFSLTAPSVNGDYDFYYDMVEDGVATVRTNGVENGKACKVYRYKDN